MQLYFAIAYSNAKLAYFSQNEISGKVAEPYGQQRIQGFSHLQECIAQLLMFTVIP